MDQNLDKFVKTLFEHRNESFELSLLCKINWLCPIIFHWIFRWIHFYYHWYVFEHFHPTNGLTDRQNYRPLFWFGQSKSLSLFLWGVLKVFKDLLQFCIKLLKVGKLLPKWLTNKILWQKNVSKIIAPKNIFRKQEH